jgi:chemotaxis protein histidine kinase CheA
LRQRGRALSREEIGAAVAATPFETSLAADLAILRDALGPEFLEYGDRIIVSATQAEQLRQLADHLLRGERVDTSIGGMRRLLREISQLHKVPLKDVLGSYDRMIRQTASRVEKEVAGLHVVGGENVWIDPKAYRPFLRALTHVFRNAVVHGIEEPDARLEIDKQETGTITCSVQLDDTSLKLCIADDGGGIDIEALRTRAVGAGLIAADQIAAVADEQILDLIFLDNFSTRQEANELAGRGVGLAVVRQLHGDVVVKTAAGLGSEFLFTLPLQTDLLR